jgi:hypothetical protein
MIDLISVSFGDGGNPSPSGEAKFCEMVDMISLIKSEIVSVWRP